VENLLTIKNIFWANFKAELHINQHSQSINHHISGSGCDWSSRIIGTASKSAWTIFTRVSPFLRARSIRRFLRWGCKTSRHQQ